MNAVLAGVANVTKATSQRANYNGSPFGANLLSLENPSLIAGMCVAGDGQSLQEKMQRERSGHDQ